MEGRSNLEKKRARKIKSHLSAGNREALKLLTDKILQLMEEASI